jgi:hypothetical protein
MRSIPRSMLFTPATKTDHFTEATSVAALAVAVPPSSHAMRRCSRGRPACELRRCHDQRHRKHR